MSAPDEDEAFIERSRAPLLDHLTELRTRLFICLIALFIGFLISFAFAGNILDLLVRPWDISAGLKEMQAEGHAGPFDMILGVLGLRDLPMPRPEYQLRIVSTAALETFLSKVKLAAFGAVVLGFPVLAWQLYRFVAPGLYKKERHAFAPFLVASPVLFIMGGALVYFILLPMLGWFSLNQQAIGGRTITLMPKIGEHLSLAIKLILGFGICFQLPVLLSLLAMAGLVNAKQLRAFWRFAVVGICIGAAAFTPPDPISMLSLVIPLVLLYEVSIWAVKIIEAGQRRRDREAGTDLVP